MAAAPDPAGLRVLTLNVLAPAWADWPRRRGVVLAGLRDLRPDVVALQEIHLGADHDEAADLLGPGYHLARHPTASEDGTTAVLASRWPFGTVHRVDLDVGGRSGEFGWGGAVVAEVLGPPSIGPLLVVHHKPMFQLGREREREQAAVRTARVVEDLVGERAGPVHVVLLGDLDAAPDSASVRFWTGRQSLEGTSVVYHDAWEAAGDGGPGHTFTPDNPLVRDGDMPLVGPRRIDYVMVRGTDFGPTLAVASCRLAFDEPRDGTWASDHYGVVADLTVPSRAPGDFSPLFLA
ncbi:endonuclease/exonuclease/phosphatase family protein [Pseudonocardia sp. KRD291]|uniref:endonuclease/exonuclease/phosphatase family protein n=1 Tax=Pseudonocardia sp. KRD291 TaxID=2792007 RepID=UPI001C49E9F1|nr:endonuclease/exonuclease/phosphatase family protein [Pseudonocardia sp. KRD291]MBW0104388.1 endonuclease/exonuclease/phosphatase family protein [Pseudonocardia sp. KRD291]